MNDNDKRVIAEYDRRREQLIKDMRHLAETLAQEATVLERSPFRPLGHWRGQAINLQRDFHALQGIADVYPSDVS